MTKNLTSNQIDAIVYTISEIVNDKLETLGITEDETPDEWDKAWQDITVAFVDADEEEEEDEDE